MLLEFVFKSYRVCVWGGGGSVGCHQYFSRCTRTVSDSRWKFERLERSTVLTAAARAR